MALPTTQGRKRNVVFAAIVAFCVVYLIVGTGDDARRPPRVVRGRGAGELQVQLDRLGKSMNGMQNAAGSVALIDANAVEQTAVPAERLAQDGQRWRKRFTLSGTNDTIFVSVASFRDGECGAMLQDMFARARHPERIHAGVVEQHAPGDKPCLHPNFTDCQLKAFCPSDNIRVRKINPKDARGPTFGRYVAMLMYRGEKFYMMIDSHNRFVPRWDQIIIDAYHRAPSKKAVLSHYPEGYEEGMDTGSERSTTTHLCKARFLDTGIPRFDGVVTTKRVMPRLQPFAAAGFLFADAALLREVPFDPNLPFLFDGEEVLYSARMWTNGWDMYSPGEGVLFHFYGREGKPKIWDDAPEWHSKQKLSEQRVQYLLEVRQRGSTQHLISDDTTDTHIVTEAVKYGMGRQRSLDDFWTFAGLDTIKRVVTKDWCAV
jgi:UDP-GlcNAc:polypeptide alpha-N-acetylglucosaminyltransferase